MELSATIFLLAVLAVFAVVDLVMLITLVRPGDERGQVIVWKAGSYTLLASAGALLLDVVENAVRAQPMQINPLIHLEVVAIIYCAALLWFRRKHGG